MCRRSSSTLELKQPLRIADGMLRSATLHENSGRRYSSSLSSRAMLFSMMLLTNRLFVLVTIVICVSASHFLDQEWDSWKSKYGKHYLQVKDELYRRTAWESNWEKIQKHNHLADQGLSTYRMAMNHFGDMTAEEVSTRSCLIYKDTQSKSTDIPQKTYIKNYNIPDAVDWRKSKCVTPVKSQGQCGSCWAFAAVGVIESRLCLKNDELITLSEQQLVDCDSDNYGCCGGFPISTLGYVAENGIMKTEDYEYTERRFICEYDTDKAINLNTSKYYILPGEENIATAIAIDGPITVGFGVDVDFMFYYSGIFDGSCSEQPNHAIIIVGYGSEVEEEEDETNEVEYWIIKNSWGEQWGEAGYGKIKRNVNKCNIADMAATIDLV
ncbi:cathepsin K-like [Pelodytes ibericus]